MKLGYVEYAKYAFYMLVLLGNESSFTFYAFMKFINQSGPPNTIISLWGRLSEPIFSTVICFNLSAYCRTRSVLTSNFKNRINNLVVTFPKFSHHFYCYLSTIFTPSLLLPFHNFLVVTFAQFSHHLCCYLCTIFTPSFM